MVIWCQAEVNIQSIKKLKCIYIVLLIFMGMLDGLLMSAFLGGQLMVYLRATISITH